MTNGTMKTLVLVRPRSAKYAHLDCVVVAGSMDDWRTRLRAVPAVDCELLGPCLVCKGNLAEEPADGFGGNA